MIRNHAKVWNGLTYAFQLPVFDHRFFQIHVATSWHSCQAAKEVADENAKQ